MKIPKLDNDWLKEPSARHLDDLFKTNGYKILFVGGCIRNTLLNEEVSDIDVATNAHPNTIIKISKDNNIKAIPTGMKHGTVTLIIDNKTYQLTTFRTDKKNFGRHAEVQFVDSLHLDASRRDLTINALYCDINGEIIDPLGVFGDLKAGIIKFIGDPNKRILEDHLRIIRFFRFQALYGNIIQNINRDALTACKKHQKKLTTLSKERISLELRKLLMASNPVRTINIMEEIGVLHQLIGRVSIKAFINYVHLEQRYNVKINWLGRLLSLQNSKAYKMILFTKKEKIIISKFKEAIHSKTPALEFSYYNGAELGLIYSVLQKSFKNLRLNKSLINAISSVEENIFPIEVTDLIPKFCGKEIGAKLKELKTQWIRSNFKLDRDQLLSKLK